MGAGQIADKSTDNIVLAISREKGFLVVKGKTGYENVFERDSSFALNTTSEKFFSSVAVTTFLNPTMTVFSKSYSENISCDAFAALMGGQGRPITKKDLFAVGKGLLFATDEWKDDDDIRILATSKVLQQILLDEHAAGRL